MNHLFEEDDDDLAPHRGRDKEITLGTGMVLVVFFSLALICAVFFGFGYTMGRKSAQPQTASTSSSDDSSSTNNTQFNSFKPSPGSPAIQAVPGYLSKQDADTANANAPSPSTASAKPVAAVANTAAPKIPDHAFDVPATPKPAPVQRVPPAPAQGTVTMVAGSPVPATGGSVVQIAAVSHAEDADALTNALKRRGYSVTARQDANDHLIHVQIGPLTSHHDAELMRSRLLSDGYNAIIK